MRTLFRPTWIVLTILCAFLLTAQPVLSMPLAQSDNTNPPDSVVKLIFIHHSTGENWLRDDYGKLGIALKQNNYFVSDTNYGWGPNTIGDRTDIPNWLEWFRSADTPTYMAALYAESAQHATYTRLPSDPGGQNEVIMFKSCFPNSNLEGHPNDPPSAIDGYTVGHAKYVYNELLKYFALHTDKLFIVITAPPLTAGNTTVQNAANARAFNNWLVYNWLWENRYSPSNVAVFDFYNILTAPTSHHYFLNGDVRHIFGTSNTSYYPSGDDHPSALGSQKATAEFLPMLNLYYRRWKAGAVNVAISSVGAQDGWILEQSEASSTGGSMNSIATTFRLGDDALDRQYRSILSFDTSSLPDTAVIFSAMLKIRGAGLVGTDPFSTHGALLADVRTGAFGSNPALQITDFQAVPNKSNFMTFNRVAVNYWNNALAGSANFNLLNRTGLTQFRLRFAKDDNDDLGADYRAFYSGNSTTKPSLWITYYQP